MRSPFTRIVRVALPFFALTSLGPRIAAGQAKATETAERSTVTIVSTPPGAEIFLDVDFVGNTPSSIRIAAGKHLVSVRREGFQEWRREVTFFGGNVILSAELIVIPSTSKASEGTPQPLADASKSDGQSRGHTAFAMSTGWYGATTKKAQAGGVTITALVRGGPAANAGLEVGDRLVRLEGKPVSAESFESEMSVYKLGAQATVSYIRDGLESVVKIMMFKTAEDVRQAARPNQPETVEPSYIADDRKYGGLNHILLVSHTGTRPQLVNRVEPRYPPLARQTSISDTVRLHAIIDKDGTVKKLEVISGHPLLLQESLDAVKQWKYQPTTLNGEAVEVDTTIDVIFSLNE